ncbi:MAG: hypothetical protein JWR19_4472 [Pedosphaera sp.]|nr:hypothetical protein [Pedosphaera sp.]
MNDKISTENINLQLAMAPVVEQQSSGKRSPQSALRISRLDLVAMLQGMATFVLIVVLSFLCYLFVSRFLFESVQVVGVSMVPTLEENGHYFLNRWALHARAPQPKDVVVIEDPADHGFSVKRVIAVAGQTVHFKNGKVFVDEKELRETYLMPKTFTFTYSQAKEQLITCGKDQYFVLGDNRPQSIDSRAYGPVPRQNILGLVMLN